MNLRWAGAGEVGKLIRRASGVCACARRREEKEFGFRGTEGRLLLLQACELRIQVAQDNAVSEKARLGGFPAV